MIITQRLAHRRSLRAFMLLLSGWCLLAALGATSRAQMRTALTPDGTLGTTVTQNGTLHTIAGGTRPGNGPNLFHSFDRFRVGTGDTASFTGPSGIANIVSRVTGGQRSDIDGTLRSDIPGAHLFLLNPSGVLFGPNARLEVSGSFHVSTADFLRFADGATFSAHVGEKSTLTVAAPTAFGFLGPTPAPVTMRGSALQVPAGETISVVGGDITLVGNDATSTAHPCPTLGAPGGRIQLTSMASSGEVGVNGVASAPDLRMEGLTRLGRIDLSQGAVVTVGSGGSRNAGAIEVRGGQLTLSGGSQLDASTQGAGRGGTVTVQATEALTLTGLNSRLTTSTSGDGNAGRVVINAPLVRLQDGADIRARAVPNSRGNAGEIEVQVGTLTLTGGANISASSEGEGRGGNLTVQATEAVMLTGPNSNTDSSRLSSNAHGAGAGGQIVITTPLLSLSGAAGIRASAEGSGNAGDILVRVGTLTMQDGSDIGTSTLLPKTTGRAGSVTVRATEAITLAGPKTRLDNTTRGSGDAGQVVVQAPLLHLTDKATINASTAGPGRGGDITMQVGTLTLTTRATINASTAGPGRGGDITMQVGTLTLTTRATIDASTAGPGQGGNVTVEATKALILIGETASLRDQTYIQARAEPNSLGNAGNIFVRVGTLTLREGAFISASSDGEGGGGNLTVRATEAVILTGPNSTGGSTRLSTNAHGAGAGGQIDVQAPLVSLSGVAGIRASAEGSGNAGDILVRVGTLTMQDGSDIGTSTLLPMTTGRAGSVTVRATEAITLAGPKTRLDNTTIIRSSTLGAGNAGSVVVEAPRVALTGGAQINSSTDGAGRGGAVTVTALEALRITGHGSGLFASTSGPGQGGNITLQAPRVGLTDQATISAESTGLGNAGNVTITVQETFFLTNGNVVTRATQADGGNIQITASTMVRLRDSAITAEVGGGASTVGGNITIDPKFVLLQNSQIVANAFEGRGGNIRIAAQQVFLADPASQVSASSALGINGQVDIRAPVTYISGTVAPLPQTFAPATEILRNRCAERLREGTVSRFVVGGRDGVPLEPGGLLPSPLEQAGQGGGVEVGEQEFKNTEAKPGEARYAQAQAPGGLEVECARWIGKQGKQ